MIPLGMNLRSIQEPRRRVWHVGPKETSPEKYSRPYIYPHTQTAQTKHLPKNITFFCSALAKKICITNFDAFSKFLHKNKSRKPHACSTKLVYSHETHTHINCTGHRSIANQAREIISCLFSLFFVLRCNFIYNGSLKLGPNLNIVHCP